MARTSVVISLGYSIIRRDAAFVASSLQSFADIDDLQMGVVNRNPIATYEPDFWLLDGSYKFRDSSPHVGLLSSDMSGLDSDFDTPITLQITFGDPHDLDGLILRFSEVTGDYADDISVQYLDEDLVEIQEDLYTPDAARFTIVEDVPAVKRVVITFNSTNKSQRYLRLRGIDFGSVFWTGEQIKKARLIEEINPTAETLPYCSLEFTLHSDVAEFSIINPEGNYALLQEGMPFDAYEQVDAQQIYLGTFYLEEWNNPTETETDFVAHDFISILERTPYLGVFLKNWEVYVDVMTVGTLIDQMMVAIDAPYELDPSLEDIELHGWIPITNYRDALQNICVAIGAYATVSRSGVVEIRPLDLIADLIEFDHIITNEEKGISQNLSLRQLVTGVEVVAHDYVQAFYLTGNFEDGGTVQTPPSVAVFNGFYDVGDHIAYMKTPTYGVTRHGAGAASAATLASPIGIEFYGHQYSNAFVAHVTGAGHLEASGAQWFDVQKTFAVYNESLPPGTKPNVLRIENVTLIGSHNAQEVAQRIYDYYQQRYQQKLRLFAPDEAVGDSVLVETLYERYLGGVVEKMSLDLSGGFRADTNIVGTIAPLFNLGKYDDTDTRFAYTGNWHVALAGEAYGGSFHELQFGEPGYVEFAFIGSQLTIVYSQFPERGTFDIFVDGELIETLSQIGPEDWQHEWMSEVFQFGYHSVKVEKVGDIAPAFDAIEIG